MTNILQCNVQQLHITSLPVDAAVGVRRCTVCSLLYLHRVESLVRHLYMCSDEGVLVRLISSAPEQLMHLFANARS